MKDPQTDDTAPIAPRRPLTGPAPDRRQPSAQAVASPEETTREMPAPAAAPTPAAGPGLAPGPARTAPSATPGPPTRAESTREQPAASGRASGPQARRARLRIARVDPWSVMKVAFALSMALAIVTVVAVAIVWTVLGAAGVWESINSSVASILSDDAGDFDVTNYVGLDRVLGLTMIVAVADVILITAIATLGAFLYNFAASLLGGLEVTLTETR